MPRAQSIHPIRSSRPWASDSPRVIIAGFVQVVPFLAFQIFLNLRSRDLRCSGQVDDVTALLGKIIEFALPVITHNERVDVVLVDVAPLLLPFLFRNDQVDIPHSFE